MDVEFMLTDSLEALRPKTVFYKTFEEAAVAVDEMISSALGTLEGMREESLRCLCLIRIQIQKLMEARAMKKVQWVKVPKKPMTTTTELRTRPRYFFTYTFMRSTYMITERSRSSSITQR